jgi:hypothetical protein
VKCLQCLGRVEARVVNWNPTAVLAEKPIRSAIGREKGETRCSWQW